jgi:hypothetical protein
LSINISKKIKNLTVDFFNFSLYNILMNYFIKGLVSGNRKYWAVMAAIGAWIVAIVDFLSSNFRPPGLFNGRFFFFILILTLISPVIYYVYDYWTRSQKHIKIKTVEETAALLEPKREQEIREKVAEDPEFATLCYQCIHFNSHLLHCKRKLSDDVSYQRVKEITINNRKYCLYWVAGSEEHPFSKQ